jgi:hypothetical protein
MLCLERRDRAKLLAGQISARDRELWVVKGAQFGADMAQGSHLGWHLKGLLIEVGYHLLWSRHQQDTEFTLMLAHTGDCRRGERSDGADRRDKDHRLLLSPEKSRKNESRKIDHGANLEGTRVLAFAEDAGTRGKDTAKIAKH